MACAEMGGSMNSEGASVSLGNLRLHPPERGSPGTSKCRPYWLFLVVRERGTVMRGRFFLCKASGRLMSASTSVRFVTSTAGILRLYEKSLFCCSEALAPEEQNVYSPSTLNIPRSVRSGM